MRRDWFNGQDVESDERWGGGSFRNSIGSGFVYSDATDSAPTGKDLQLVLMDYVYISKVTRKCIADGWWEDKFTICGARFLLAKVRRLLKIDTLSMTLIARQQRGRASRYVVNFGIAKILLRWVSHVAAALAIVASLVATSLFANTSRRKYNKYSCSPPTIEGETYSNFGGTILLEPIFRCLSYYYCNFIASGAVEFSGTLGVRWIFYLHIRARSGALRGRTGRKREAATE